jgi:hypothetical protein
VGSDNGVLLGVGVGREAGKGEDTGIELTATVGIVEVTPLPPDVTEFNKLLTALVPLSVKLHRTKVKRQKIKIIEFKIILLWQGFKEMSLGDFRFGPRSQKHFLEVYRNNLIQPSPCLFYYK